MYSDMCEIAGGGEVYPKSASEAHVPNWLQKGSVSSEELLDPEF
jgi:hypothetical protein